MHSRSKSQASPRLKARLSQSNLIVSDLMDHNQFGKITKSFKRSTTLSKYLKPDKE